MSLLFTAFSYFRRESREDRDRKAQESQRRDDRLKKLETDVAAQGLLMTGFEQMIERAVDGLNHRCHNLEQQFTAVPQMQQDMGTMKAEMKHIVEGLGKVERRFEKFGDKMDKMYDLLTQRS